MSVVAYPFRLRRDILEPKSFDEGSVEAVSSELSLFISTEEGEVRHFPDYGVKKRDLLFGTDFDEPTLGILLFRIQDKVSRWFNSVTVNQLYLKEKDKNKATIKVEFDYNGISSETEVTIQ